MLYLPSLKSLIVYRSSQIMFRSAPKTAHSFLLLLVEPLVLLLLALRLSHELGCLQQTGMIVEHVLLERHPREFQMRHKGHLLRSRGRKRGTSRRPSPWYHS